MSDCYFRKELTEMGINIDLDLIDSRMHELEAIIGFRFRDIRNLADAMCVVKITRKNAGRNSKEYYNNVLATVGDSVLKLVLSDSLFRKGLHMGELTEYKSCLESNDRLYSISEEKGIYRYAFNEAHFFREDAPDHEKLPDSKHNQYFEAIVGAVYYDSGFEKCRDWLLDNYYGDILDLIESE